jgi:hypothetical protein
MALDIEQICTDADLLARAGEQRVKRAKPELTERTAARNEALLEVLASLTGRSPPVRETDLADITELRVPVMLRALQIIMQNAMTGTDALHAELARQYGDEYRAVSKRAYTLRNSLRSPSGGSFRMERR